MLVWVLSLVTAVISAIVFTISRKRNEYDFECLSAIILVLSCFTVLIFGSMCLCRSYQYNQYIAEQESIEEILNSCGGQWENANAGISNTILELNEWLIKARADVKMFGMFSSYYGLDLDSLEYIGVVEDE